MPRSSAICFDASVIVNWLTQSGASPAREAVETWVNERRSLIAPVLLHFEATNALYRREKAGLLPSGASDQGLRAILALDITTVSDVDLHVRALEMARRFNLAAAYDAHYLALADREDVELWTCDKRLFNSVRHRFSRIRLAAPAAQPAN